MSSRLRQKHLSVTCELTNALVFARSLGMTWQSHGRAPTALATLRPWDRRFGKPSARCVGAQPSSL
jgi:hypothetical protein